MMTMDEREKADIIRAVFDALPSLVFVVDQDIRIQEYNAAAADFLTTGGPGVIKQRTGNILHCLHSMEVPEGCGEASFCANCIIRNSVMEAFEGKRVVRRRAKIELVREDEKVEMYALITTTPFEFLDRPLALLVIEDISEIAELQRMIPICVGCRKVRDDKDAWMGVETYFKRNWDVDFTHGYCPECYQIEMDKLKARSKI
jgi:PAS domain-containing protein